MSKQQACAECGRMFWGPDTAVGNTCDDCGCKQCVEHEARIADLERINYDEARDWAHDDTAIRKLAARVLPESEVYGDSNAVPTLVDVVEAMHQKMRDDLGLCQHVRQQQVEVERFLRNKLSEAEGERKRLNGIYKSAVNGRKEMRDGLRRERQAREQAERERDEARDAEKEATTMARDATEENGQLHAKLAEMREALEEVEWGDGAAYGSGSRENCPACKNSGRHAPDCKLAKAISASPAPSASPTWPYVLAFAHRMEEKLAQNRHKGDREGWLKDSPEALSERVREELGELCGEIGYGGTADDVWAEAADVANMAMMVADSYMYRNGLESDCAASSPALSVREEVHVGVDPGHPDGSKTVQYAVIDPADLARLRAQVDAMGGMVKAAIQLRDSALGTCSSVMARESAMHALASLERTLSVSDDNIGHDYERAEDSPSGKRGWRCRACGHYTNAPSKAKFSPCAVRDAGGSDLARLRRVVEAIRHCDNCGGSWYDDGNNSGCPCRYRRVVEAAREHEGIIAHTAHSKPGDACKCDPSVGWVCEMCAMAQFCRDLLQALDAKEEG